MKRVAILMSLLVARAVAGQTVQFCQGGYAASAGGVTHVYNFRKSPVPGAEPTPLPAGVRVQIVPLPAQPTPVPTQYAGTTGCSGADVGYVSVPADSTLIGPGLAVNLAAWTISQDGVASTASNTVLKPPVPLSAPVLLP